MLLSDLKIEVQEEWSIVEFNGEKIKVRKWLSQKDKADLLSYILDNSIDETNGTFSDLRLETYTILGIIKYYTDIEFDEDDLSEPAVTYDKLIYSKLYSKILAAIETNEREYIYELIENTKNDISRYNNSFVGMMNLITSEAVDLSQILNDTLDRIQNKEGIEQLAVFRDMYGQKITK